MRAGGSVMLDARQAALNATDCRFEAGFGGSPGSGNLFRVRSGLLVRVENCVFRGPFRSVFDRDDAATYVFSGCAFEEMEPHRRGQLESPPAGVRFEDCVFAWAEPADSRRERRSLAELNPDWVPPKR